MKRLCYSSVLLFVLTGCGDPLAGVDRLSDVTLSPADPVAQALPNQAEVAREGFFGTDAAKGQASVPEASQGRRAGGFLNGLLRRVPQKPQPQTDPDDVPAETAQTPRSPDTAPERAGLFGLFRPALKVPDPAQKVASLTPTNDIDNPSVQETTSGLKRTQRRSGPDATDVPYGTKLPFGQIARVCEARSKPIGRKVDKISARGFALYDSAPELAQARTFYVTGYDDGCPRQFTAAAALFGEPSLYELLRFSPAGKNLPYSETDKAYDKIKATFCGASRRKPCGAKVGKLDKTTAFISAYEFFGDTSRWAEYLVHDGTTLAAALKN